MATRGVLQAKLAVGSVDDPLEHEADEVAEKVLRMPDPAAGAPAEQPGLPVTPSGARLSRKCTACKEEDEQKGVQVQRRAAPGASAGVAEAPPIVERALGNAGRPLDAGTRAYFEPRFGFDLSRVRIHADARSAESARAVNAQAYTVGQNIVFGQGRYAPGEREGKRLLAHELAHVAQQRFTPSGAVLWRRPDGLEPPKEKPKEEKEEKEKPKENRPDCTPKQVGEIDAAVKEADRQLGVALPKLKDPPATEVKDALFLAFLADDSATMTKVEGVLKKVQAGLPSATIECEQPGDTGYDFFCTDSSAYVRSAAAMVGVGNIHICMGHWPNFSATGQAELLIHEASHRFANTGDNGYFDGEACAESSQTKAVTTSDRLDNADSYSCFVHHLVQGTATAIHTSAESERGTALKVVQDPIGPIDLGAADTKSVSFRIENAHPDFKFRWIIADKDDQRYLVRTSSGEISRAEYMAEKSIYIPEKTRALLKERGITNAVLRCRVLRLGKQEQVIDLPIEFK